MNGTETETADISLPRCKNNATINVHVKTHKMFCCRRENRAMRPVYRLCSIIRLHFVANSMDLYLRSKFFWWAP